MTKTSDLQRTGKRRDAPMTHKQALDIQQRPIDSSDKPQNRRERRLAAALARKAAKKKKKEKKKE